MNAPAAAKTSPAALPAGFLAAPVSSVDRGAPLRLCAVIHPTAAQADNALVPLGEMSGASQFLGCVLDAGGRVREWLTWSVQTIDPPGGSLAVRDVLNNPLLDAEWTARAQALRDLSPDLYLQTGWETAHPAPMFLDPAGGEPSAVPGEAWELCRDDAALAAAGLPPWSSSVNRYLWSPGADGKPRFAPVSAEDPAPEGQTPVTLQTVSGGRIPFNPGGGLLLARKFLPLTFEEFADALAGQAWPGLPQGKASVPLAPQYEELRHIGEPENAGGFLFSARRGKAGRLAESFHLKLHVLLGAAREVRAMVAARKMPLLNLSAASFRVSLGESAAGLPFLWTAKPALVRAGGALALAVPTTGEDVRYFLPGPGGERGPSLYQPAAFGRVASGRGTVRLRKIQPTAEGWIAAEGTLVADENLPEATSDLLCMRIRLGDSGRVTLYAHLESKEGLAAGEARFRTVPQRFPAAVGAALTAAAGATFAGTSFETLPLLGSPCDLHALGVLAVRTLLVNETNTIAAALDETLSLARQAGAAPDASQPLENRLAALAGEDARWIETLGPQRLSRTAATAEAAFDLLPADLWWRALALILRCFPGGGADSTCRDLGDFPEGAPEAVFDRFIHDLEALTASTRSLVTLDWQQNREIRAAIRRSAEWK